LAGDINVIGVIIALLIVILVATGLLTGGTMAASAYDRNDGDNVTNESAPTIAHHIDPSQPNTWPSGDRIWNCCRAIAFAEGYNVVGSNPANLNNPGDLSDGAATYGSEFHSGSNITKFPDAVTGWSWLYTKIQNAAAGRSSVYDPSMSWREIGAKWAPPNAEIWAANVATALGVDADSSLGDYVNG
jgi:hypothetical protein